MAPSKLLTILALTAAVSAPAFAQDGARRRPDDDRTQPRQGDRSPQRAQPRERAVPRAIPPPPAQQQSRRDDDRRYDNRGDHNRRDDNNRGYDNNRRYDNNGRYDNGRRYDSGRYDNRRPGYGGYSSYRRYTPRVVRPTIVRVIPYRPYVYRPSYSIGVYYGSGGHYPYGYTPRGYFEPIPGRPYGGVRITGVPRDARVFADGYYVGIVNDFDGIFQHMNLEAGPHHIEIDLGYDAIRFDVYVRPGETTTFRADRY